MATNDLNTGKTSTIKKLNLKSFEKRVQKAVGLSFYREIEYPDDDENYEQRIPLEERIEYLTQLRSSTTKTTVSKDQVRWVDQHRTNALELALRRFPRHKVWLLNFVTTVFWDYCYLLCLAGWCFLVSYRLTNKSVPVLDSFFTFFDVQIVPLGCMFLCQLIPVLGVLYFVPCCNDLTRLVAQKRLGFWCVSAVLLAQFVEWAWYGGRGRSDRAGQCIISNIETDTLTQANARANTRVGVHRAWRWSAPFPFPFRRKPVPDPQPEPRGSKSGSLSDGCDRSGPQPEDRGSDVENGVGTSPSFVEEMKAGGNSVEAAASAAIVEQPVGGGEQMPIEEGKLDEEALGKLTYLKRREMERRLEEQRAREFAAEEKRQRDLLIKDWTEWQCKVCGKPQRQPTRPAPDYDVVFDTRGLRFQRDIAVLKKKFTGPICAHCMTPVNYVPPLGSAHLFPHNPDKDAAFGKYPTAPTVQNGLPSSLNIPKKLKSGTLSLLFGLRESSKSLLILNDWRLPWYLSARFEEVPRPDMKPPADAPPPPSSVVTQWMYEQGEAVECRSQKAHWSRARVIVARSNHIYDIRYDTGEELRFVKGSALRPPPLKGYLAYQAELCAVLVLVSAPACLALPLLDSSLSTLLAAPLALSALWLLLLHLASLLTDSYTFSRAGCVPITALRLLFIIPLASLVLSAAAPIAGFGWVFAAATLAASKVLSLPVLYMMRPSYALMALILFGQTIACTVSAAMCAASGPSSGIAVVPLAPGISAALTLMLYRYWLVDIWDVSLRIRPAPVTQTQTQTAGSRVRAVVVGVHASTQWVWTRPAKTSSSSRVAAVEGESEFKSGGGESEEEEQEKSKV